MKDYSMLELAFLGDAIHTLFIRKKILSEHNLKINETHKLCSKFCSAKWQSQVLDKLELDTQEAEIIRMARNSKTKHIAKNANPAEYHKATAFEALVGWHYLKNNEERLNEILNFSVKEENHAD